MNMMRNILLAATLATTGYVSAQTPVNQSALAPTKVTSVKQALTMKDDAPVMLKGQVVKSLGDENINSEMPQARLQSILMMNYGTVVQFLPLRPSL